MESSALQGLQGLQGLQAQHLPLPVLQGRQALLGRKVIRGLARLGLLGLLALLGLLERRETLAKLGRQGSKALPARLAQPARKEILAHTSLPARLDQLVRKGLLAPRAPLAMPLRWQGRLGRPAPLGQRGQLALLLRLPGLRVRQALQAPPDLQARRD